MVQTITTKELKPGTVIMIKTGCKFLNNIELSTQIVTGTFGNKRIEVSFESGLVASFGPETQHKLAI